MKYTFEIELNEDRTNCIDCPLCNSDDYCVLQDEDDLFLNDGWDYQLSNCPLKEVDPQTQADLKFGRVQVFKDLIARIERKHIEDILVNRGVEFYDGVEMLVREYR